MKELMNLYEKMTPTQQGVFGFTCLANQDDDGFQRVMSKVPRLSYTQTHQDWQTVLGRLCNFFKYYAWTYWELRAHRAECLALSCHYMNKANKALDPKDEKSIAVFWEAQEKSEKYQEDFESYTKEMRALHQAAKQVCVVESFPLVEIRKLAGISNYKIEEGETTLEYLNKYISLFQTVAES